MIKCEIMEEAGYNPAIFGVSLSKEQTVDRAKVVAVNLAPHDGGHNKFLEHIDVWVKVKAPRNWWSQADTYRMTSKLSGSTMHNVHKRKFTQADFNSRLIDRWIEDLNALLDIYNKTKSNEDLETLKDHLPEGYLQERVWKLNYRNIRDILINRSNHRLPSWRLFCEFLRENVEHPELLPGKI